MTGVEFGATVPASGGEMMPSRVRWEVTEVMTSTSEVLLVWMVCMQCIMVYLNAHLIYL